MRPRAIASRVPLGTIIKTHGTALVQHEQGKARQQGSSSSKARRGLPLPRQPRPCWPTAPFDKTGKEHRGARREAEHLEDTVELGERAQALGGIQATSQAVDQR